MKARRSHWNTLAHRCWPSAEWIDVEGPYALVAHCRVITVTLWATHEEAEKAKAIIDWSACGGACHRAHEIVTLPG